MGESTASALQAFFIVFASWALGRELAPDHNPAAFVGTALAFASLWWWPAPSLLLLLTALALSRVVNRSTGLTARLGDSLIVTALVIWTMVSLESPLCGVVGALAFMLDARLADPHRRQWSFAAVCLTATGAQVWLTGTTGISASISVTLLAGAPYLIVGGTLVAFLLLSLGQGSVSSLGDVGGRALDPSRVRGGMLVVWLLVLQMGLQGLEAIETTMPVVAAMAGVVLAGWAGRFAKSPGMSSS